MRRFLLFISLFVISITVSAQELNATVIIDAEQTGQPNLQVFRTLQQELTEFLNNTKWTNKVYKNQERIDCSFNIIVSGFESTSFTASVQIQSSRPVFNSTYESPIYNYNDRNFNFDYTEFQPLNFNPNSFDSNLVSVLTYHVYTIIGLDAATFELEGGMEYFQIAKQIVNTAAGSNFLGWKATDGSQSRFRYNDALLANIFSDYHAVLYEYHRNGMDVMSEKPRDAKLAIIAAVERLRQINDRRPNSFLLRTFFDAKSTEIMGVFSGGPNVDILRLMENLTRIAPTKRDSWREIKF